MPIENSELFENIIKPFINKYSEEFDNTNPFLSKEALKARKREEMREALYNVPAQVSIEEGMDAFAKGFVQISTNDEITEIREECGHIAQRLTGMEEWETAKQEGSPHVLREFLQVSGSFMDLLYRVGEFYYKEGAYKESAAIFFVCATLDPLSISYWQAMGIAYRAQQEFSYACQAFATAHSLNPDDPTFLIYLAECQLLLNAYDEAKLCIQKAEELVRDNSINEEWNYLLIQLKEKIHSVQG